MSQNYQNFIDGAWGRALRTDDNPPQLLPARNKEMTLHWRGLYWHSRHDPKKEAQRQLSELNINFAEQIVVFIGAGLAYNIDQFANNKQNPIIWFEPCRKILDLALQIHHKLKNLIENGRIRLIEKTPRDEEWVKYFGKHQSEDIIFCIHRASYTADIQYENFRKALEAFLNRKNVNQATLTRFDKTWTRNLLANAPLLLHAQPVKKLFQMFPNKAALICAAGPSLSQSMHIIQSLRKKVILISVDTALAPLQAHGIEPDFVVCVDPQMLSYHYVAGCTKKNSIFIVDPSVSYLCLRMLSKQNLFYFWSPFALSHLISTANSTNSTAQDPGKIAFGGSVSTNAYDLAVKMGCNPILWLGLDLAFGNKQAHVMGSVLEELHYHKQSRFLRQEFYHHWQMSALPKRHIMGQESGRPVQLATNDKLIIFHQWFHRRFSIDATKGINIINLSSGGADIIGAPRKNWQEYKNLPNQDPIQIPQNNLTKEMYQKRIARLKAKFSVLQTDFQEYAKIVQEGSELSRKIQNEIKKLAKNKNISSQYNTWIKKLAAVDKKILQKNELSNIAGDILQAPILQILNEPLRKQKQTNPIQKQIHLAKNNCQLYNSLKEASVSYQKKLERAQRILASIYRRGR